MQNHSVLVVEDDDSSLALISAFIAGQGYKCDAVRDGADAIGCLRRRTYCAVVLDLLLPAINGFEVLQYISAERAPLLKQVIVMTGADPATLEHFDARAVKSVLRKPVDIAQLTGEVIECLSGSHLH